jgi:L-aspartate oxidase
MPAMVNCCWGREGGHGRNRIAHANGDATGREIMRALTARVREADNIQIWQHAFLIDLLTQHGECKGAIIWNEWHGKTLLWAKQTILAAGGVGQVYRESTNPSVATGDGQAAAFRAGAQVRDMEFMQFHPHRALHCGEQPQLDYRSGPRRRRPI